MSGLSRLGWASLWVAASTMASAQSTEPATASERFRVVAQVEPRYASDDGRFGASAKVSTRAVASDHSRFVVTPKRTADCDPNGDTIFADGFE